MTGPTPEEAWEKVWKPILEDEHGTIDDTKLKALLFDYGALLADVSELFSYFTDDRIRNPQTPIAEVIDLTDEITAGLIDDGIRQIISYLFDVVAVLQGESPAHKYKQLMKELNQLYEAGVSND